MTTPKDTHIIVLPGDGSSYLRCQCKHCGTQGALLLPAGLRTVAGFTRGFIADHRSCKPRPATEGTGG